MAPETSVAGSLWQQRSGNLIRNFLAPLLFLWSGFFITDFILSGAYTWPRTSRIFVLTATLVILGYEFVFKERQAASNGAGEPQAWQAVLYSCGLPFLAGIVALLVIVFVRF